MIPASRGYEWLELPFHPYGVNDFQKDSFYQGFSFFTSSGEQSLSATNLSDNFGFKTTNCIRSANDS
jgi:hypothetical protein